MVRFAFFSIGTFTFIYIYIYTERRYVGLLDLAIRTLYVRFFYKVCRKKKNKNKKGRYNNNNEKVMKSKI